MITDQALVRTALALSLAGLLVLFLVLRSAELPVEDVTVIGKERAGGRVRVEARVVSLRYAKNGTITLLTIAEEVERRAVSFTSLNLTVGSRVVLEGRIHSYEGVPELVVERVVAQE